MFGQSEDENEFLEVLLIELLDDEIELDETYFGGRSKGNRDRDAASPA